MNTQEHSREALLESLREDLREALEFNRQDALEAACPGAEELGLLLLSVDICFATSAAMAVNSLERVAATIHGCGTHQEIIVARFRAILKSRNYLGTPEKGIRRLDPKTAHERRVVGPDSWLYSGQ